MDTLDTLAIELHRATPEAVKTIGGKGDKLSRLHKSGFTVPPGFCLTVHAYHRFLKAHRLDEFIQFELSRKSFTEMRWEEIWDASLRIRTAFQRCELPPELVVVIQRHLGELTPGVPLAVRSSSPKEDASDLSFAGLHESFINIRSFDELVTAVRGVWASLWSDAALLYQQELNLDPFDSSIAIVIQELISADVSGVAFGRDPRQVESDHAIIEAVPGLCQDLVDGAIDPDRWIMDRSNGQVITHREGQRSDQPGDLELLGASDLKQIFTTLNQVESLFDWPPDMEWTGTGIRFHVLQARPITGRPDPDTDKKSYYRTLTPNDQRLKKLAIQVEQELIPDLEAEGVRFASEILEKLDDSALADAIDQREQSWQRWKTVYADSFIPFAHGIRRLATCYNDAVKPENPYEFLDLLVSQPMLSTRRNQALADVAAELNRVPEIRQQLTQALEQDSDPADPWATVREICGPDTAGASFLEQFTEVMETQMDVALNQERLSDHLGSTLRLLLELSEKLGDGNLPGPGPVSRVAELEQKLYTAVGPEGRTDAGEILTIGRLSWRLRDDDNLLLGRIESQLLRALQEGKYRLQASGRYPGAASVVFAMTGALCHALRHPPEKMTWTDPKPSPMVRTIQQSDRFKPRQMTGQPASPGIASGKARCIRGLADISRFRSGEILVCDAVQPNMTHLVLLAAGIVERRGGMLVHGSIIAREMGIPCVNGIPRVVEKITEGELLTVDGDLGIVTLGEPEFDLEQAER